MRAIIRKSFGGPEVLTLHDLPDPETQPGHVLLEVKAFGINHAEAHMRRGEWPEAAPVSGIECVGLVKECADGSFQPGQRVAALMGGMGRTINGSYAELTCPPATNVVPINSRSPMGRFGRDPRILRDGMGMPAWQSRTIGGPHPGDSRRDFRSWTGRAEHRCGLGRACDCDDTQARTRRHS